MSIAILAAALAAALFGQTAVEQPEMATVEGKHIILKVRADDLKLLNDPEAWVAKLDRSYEAFADLVGAVPFGGKKITILSVEENPGGWAVAGNPVKWHRKWVAPTFVENVNKGDWVFGINHELGHDFDLDDRWNWDAELLANFKMDYVFPVVQGKVFFDGAVCDYSNPQSKRLTDFYRIGDARQGTANRMLHGGWEQDGSHSKWTDTVRDIGWDPFKKTFRWFNGLAEDQLVNDGLSRRSLFIRALQEFSSDTQVGARFIDWGFSHLTVDAPSLDAAARVLHRRDWNAEVAARPLEAKEGEPVTLGVDLTQRIEKTFAKGFGTHAFSEIVFDLGGRYATFESLAGVAGKAASEGRWGSVQFEVHADGKRLVQGGVLSGGSMYETIRVDVRGVRQLKLVVNDGGNGIWGDGCAWVEPKVVDANGKATYLSDLKPVSAKQDYETLKVDTDIDGNPLLFCYGPCTRPARMVAKVGDRSVAFRKGKDGVRYEAVLPPLPSGQHDVWLTIRVGNDGVTQHEMVRVNVKKKVLVQASRYCLA